MDQVKIGRYQITTVGTVKDGKTVYFQGIDVATALRHGTAKNDNGAAVMYGFTSKINKNMVEVYADGNKLTKSVQEDTEQAWILNYGVTTNPNENNCILNNAFNVLTMKKLQMEAMPGYTFEISIDKSKLVNNQETVSWNASEAVQKIGPQPNWPLYPNSLTDDGTRPLRPATTTNFNATTTFSLNDLANLDAGDKLVITFSEPMYKGDFGIGFDFSDDLLLTWADDNKSVEVTFNNVTKGKGEVCNIYIMRLSDSSGNMIAAPIHHSFTRKPTSEDPVTITPTPTVTEAPTVTGAPTATKAPTPELTTEEILEQLTPKRTGTLYVGGKNSNLGWFGLKLPNNVVNVTNFNEKTLSELDEGMVPITITYKSSKPGIVEVKQNGRLIAKKYGVVVITATVTMQDGTQEVYTRKISVKKATIEFIESTVHMKVGEEAVFKIKVNGLDEDSIIWMSSKKDGVVVKKNPGSTTATIKAVSAKTDWIYLIVNGMKKSIKVIIEE